MADGRARSPGASTASSAGCSGATRRRRSSTSSCRCSSSFLFGAIFSGDQETLDVIVPGHRRHERHVDDVQRAGHEHHLPARGGRAQAHARHAAAAGSYLGGVAANAVTNAAVQVVHRRPRRAAVLRHRLAQGLARARRLRVAGVATPRRARRRLLARDPELRRRPGLHEHRLPAGHLHLRRLLRRRQRARSSCATSPRSCRSPTSSTASRPRWSPARRWPTTRATSRSSRAWGVVGRGPRGARVQLAGEARLGAKAAFRRTGGRGMVGHRVRLDARSRSPIHRELLWPPSRNPEHLSTRASSSSRGTWPRRSSSRPPPARCSTSSGAGSSSCSPCSRRSCATRSGSAAPTRG